MDRKKDDSDVRFRLFRKVYKELDRLDDIIYRMEAHIEILEKDE